MMHSAPHQAPRDRDPLRPDDLPRKKIRKGTRSCWECKHRKVRCNFAADGDPSCRECLARGSVCRSQDLPEPEKSRDSDRTSLSDRMARVESMLEKLLLRVDSSDDFDQNPVDATNTTETTPTVVPLQNNAPIFSLFRNDKLEFRQTEPISPASSSPAAALVGLNNRESSNICRKLLALVPPPSTLRFISEFGRHIWWLDPPKLFEDCENASNLNPAEALSTCHPALISKTLLYISVCLQFLPPSVDTAALNLPSSPKTTVEQTLSLVSRWVVADDAIMFNIDGVEALSLYCQIWMTGGNMKSAWLSNRRILDICQILGFHRSPKPGLDKDDQYRRGVLVWRFCIISDRILSLILGVYHSVGNTAIDRHFDEQDVAVKNMTMLHVTMIDHLLRLSGSIIERNQGFSEVTPAMLEETQRIDSELNLVNPSLIIPDDGEPTSYGKLGLQLAFSQLMLWLHLPLLVHSDPDDCYEYNRQTCLQSCRDVISSYVAIRSINQNTRQYQLLDFGAFTAALTIIIGTLGYYGKRYQHPDNSDAVERVMAHLEELSTNDHSDKVSSRGFQILQTLREVAKGNSPPGYPLFDPNSSEDERPSQLNLDIPYFGTICLERRAFADPVQQNPSAALPTTLPSSDVGGQGPSSAWMGLVLDEYSLAHSTNPNAWSGPSSVLDPTAEFWALNPEFTFQPHSMGFFNDDWGMGL